MKYYKDKGTWFIEFYPKEPRNNSGDAFWKRDNNNIFISNFSEDKEELQLYLDELNTELQKLKAEKDSLQKTETVEMLEVLIKRLENLKESPFAGTGYLSQNEIEQIFGAIDADERKTRMLEKISAHSIILTQQEIDWLLTLEFTKEEKEQFIAGVPLTKEQIAKIKVFPGSYHPRVNDFRPGSLEGKIESLDIEPSDEEEDQVKAELALVQLHQEIADIALGDDIIEDDETAAKKRTKNNEQ